LAEGPQEISEKARKLFKIGNFARCYRPKDFTAVKVHVGEAGNTTHLPPQCIKGLIEELLALDTKPFLTDTNALYTGHRHNAVDHMLTAAAHGYGIETLGVPFIVSGGLLGTSETTVQLDGHVNRHVFIADDIVKCQSILSIAHFTGHPAACAAATLKTLAMGCASKKGKMSQHAALTLSITDNCTGCGQCIACCPAGAITLKQNKADIDRDKCIGCAECLAVCRFGAVKCNWAEETEALQKNIAEYALAVLKGKRSRAAFFNFAVSITKDCDCFGKADAPRVADDVGILASTDPVAVDKATIDLVEQRAGRKLSRLIGNSRLNPNYQIEHAVRIGLGSGEYNLVSVDRA